jgi:hypothetical protein
LIYLQFFSPFNCFYKHEAQPATIQYSITGVFPEDIFSTKNQTQLFCIGLVLSRLHVKKLWGLSQKVGLSSPDIFPTMHQEMELPTHQIHVQTSGAAQPGFYSDMFTRQKCQNLSPRWLESTGSIFCRLELGDGGPLGGWLLKKEQSSQGVANHWRTCIPSNLFSGKNNPKITSHLRLSSLGIYCRKVCRRKSPAQSIPIPAGSCTLTFISKNCRNKPSPEFTNNLWLSSLGM